MNFWAIAFQYQEDVWFDLDKKEDTFDLSSTCFLPTKEMAQQYIEDELSTDYVPVKIELETVNHNRSWSWNREPVPQWD